MKKSTIKVSLFAFFSSARFNFVGQMMGGEIISLIFFPYLKIKTLFIKYPLLYKIGLGYLLFLSSLVLSDFINGTSPENYLRGWASIIFSFLSVVFLTYNLIKSKNNIYAYLLFGAISFFLFGRELTSDVLQSGQTNIFKIYFMTGTNFLILLLASMAYDINKKIPLLILGSYSILSLILDSRANGVVFFISALLLFVKVYNIKLTKFRVFSLSFIFLLLLSFSYVFYINSILSGKLTGDNTKQVQQLENPYNPIALLTVGRAEFAVTVIAIKDNSIWGFGSWALDKTGKYGRVYDMLNDTKTPYSNLKIPAHSIILTAWLWGGIISALGALLIFIFAFRCVWSVYRYGSMTNTLLILIPLSIEHLWHFLFSPIGHMRTTVPFFIAMAIFEYYKMLKNNQISINK